MSRNDELTVDGGDENKESIGGLFARLADNATDLIRAEADVYRATAMHRLDLAKPALIGLVAAALVVQAALVCLLVMISVALSSYLGPIGAGILVALIAVICAALVARYAFKRLGALSAGENDD